MNERKFRQVKEDQVKPGDFRALAQVNVSTSELAEKFGVSFEDYEEEGLGVTRVGAFITDTGNQFFVQEYPTEDSVCTNIVGLFKPRANSELIDEVLEVLGLTSEAILFLYHDAELIQHELWRQDDNRHKFLIEIFPCKTDAVIAMGEFENLDHKQIYWVTKVK